MQLQNGLSSTGSGHRDNDEEWSEASKMLSAGPTFETLIQRLQNYSKIIFYVGFAIIEHDAIQLRKRLISFVKHEQLKNGSMSSLRKDEDSSKTLERIKNILVSDHDKKVSNQKESVNDSNGGYDTTVPFQPSHNSFNNLPLQSGSQLKRSSSDLRCVSHMSTRLENISRDQIDVDKSNVPSFHRHDEVFLDSRLKRRQSTQLSSTTNENEKKEDHNLEEESEPISSLNESNYLCYRAKRMKRTANLLLQIQRLHNVFIVQVIDYMIDEISS